MGVVIWKKQKSYFGSLVGKTSFDIAVENYARTGSAEDFERLQAQAAVRPMPAPSDLTPRDIVLKRVFETNGCLRELTMLRALVRPRTQVIYNDFREGTRSRLKA